MKSKILALVAVFSLLTCSLNLMAKERRGADLVITKLDGQQIKGELLEVKQRSLLLLDSSTATKVSIDIPNVKTIRIPKKSKQVLAVGLGLVIGGAAGTAAGYGLSFAAWHEGDPTFPWAGGIIGLMFGGGLGAVLSRSEKIEVEGMSAVETEEILMKLRSKARITNFQ